MIPTTNTADGDSSNFDALQVDASTVRFGPAKAEVAHSSGHTEDVDSDGDLDLVLHFSTQSTGITCGMTTATLTGKTFGGESISGTDSIKTVGCK